jgi:hypothetical protein
MLIQKSFPEGTTKAWNLTQMIHILNCLGIDEKVIKKKEFGYVMYHQ